MSPFTTPDAGDRRLEDAGTYQQAAHALGSARADITQLLELLDEGLADDDASRLGGRFEGR